MGLFACCLPTLPRKARGGPGCKDSSNSSRAKPGPCQTYKAWSCNKKYIYIYTYNNGMEYIIMNIQTCVYMHISIHPSIGPSIHTYLHTRIHTYTHIHTYTLTHIHTYTHTHIRTCRIIYFNISTYVRTCSNLVSYNIVSASRIPKPDSHRTLGLGVQSGSVRSL